MRNILALVATFTLSTTSTMSVLACNPTSDRGTTNVFDWNQAFKAAGSAGETTSDFFNFLNSQGGQSWGKDLYSTINQHINLSILKNNHKYKSDYDAALITVNSQIDNKIASLKAKFGRGWEKQWKKILSGYNNSVEQYKDDQLKDIATKIINTSYVSQNYGDYEYYTTSEIYPMLRDVFEEIKAGKFTNVQNYINSGGIYAKTIWIVIKANNPVGNATTLQDAITTNKDWNAITVSNPVAKTVGDVENGEHISSTYNTVNGLLSDNQAKIAQVMMTAQEPIWVRQIVVPFNIAEKDKALKVAITKNQFSDNKPKINEIVQDIKNLGFDQTFTFQGTTATGTTDTTGDLGLININSATKDNAPFYYYLYRYVTSAQGVGKNVIGNIQQDTLDKYTAPTNPTDDALTTLLPLIDHTNNNKQSITSQYNDLIYMNDIQSHTSLLPDATKNNGPGVGIFIDTAGIHFIETPGITYQATASTDSTYNIIQEFNKKKQNPQNLLWNDVSPLADRPGGLSNSPYLDYLQTAFLLQKNKGLDTTIDLNKTLGDFTATSTDLGSPNWWDYNLFFDNNASLIHWNISDLTGSTPSLDDTTIDGVAKSLQTWFTNVKNSRWDNKQALYVNGHFQNAVKTLNTSWDAFGINAPTARLNENISDYLTKVGKQTLWWYDPNIITNN
ncbi:hypothetical protein [Spiroplasma sp. AdecLV25b]|uniref:hypothetical protein n=1 Tax=Spiroplasma sp. AdecLV25b TaxID=3027162 RepID=UPI0027E15B1A|nr:hypothetical protein [Spiroplasma sp. AdecLV25b]